MVCFGVEQARSALKIQVAVLRPKNLAVLPRMYHPALFRTRLPSLRESFLCRTKRVKNHGFSSFEVVDDSSVDLRARKQASSSNPTKSRSS